MERDCAMLADTRPTAVNLRWAIDRMLTRLRNTRSDERVRVAYDEARRSRTRTWRRARRSGGTARS